MSVAAAGSVGGTAVGPSKGERRKEQILDAARDVLIARGPEGFVLREVAERVGITHSNLQYYFPTTADLLVATFEREVLKYTAAATASIDRGHGLHAQIKGIVASGMRLNMAPEIALWRMALGVAEHNDDMAAVLQLVNEQYRRSVAADLQRIAPGLPADRIPSMTRALQAVLDGLAYQLALDPQPQRQIDCLQDAAATALIGLVGQLDPMESSAGDFIPSTKKPS